MASAPRPRSRPVRLADVATYLAVPGHSQDVEVSGVALDSRSVQPGDLFAALPGRASHGSQFAHGAVASGAVAIITDLDGAEDCVSTGVPVLVIESPRARLGQIASLVYGNPSAAMQVIGITGTNGKTTVAAMVESGLRSGGHTTGMIGTIGVTIAGESFAGARTTPEAPDLHALLGVMRDAGVSAVVMEVSSIAMDEHRVDGVVYDIAAFTNLSQDHLDYHGTMDAYFEAKAGLFTEGHARHAVIGVDDGWGRRLNECCTLPRETWSAAGLDADWTVDSSTESTSSSILVQGPSRERQLVEVPLLGDFNAANALCAYVVLRRAGIGQAQAATGIAAAKVPGRMQIIDSGEGPRGVVDYAHTPDAIRRVLEALGSQIHASGSAGRVIAVVGAGGDRDSSKRAQMGAIAARLADVVVITDDNPRSEDPAAIRAAIRAGALEADLATRADVREQADRARAISVAVALAEPGDTVVVLGKGHERGQEVAGVVTAFDDAETLGRALGVHGHVSDGR